jgi:RimJ/RimL family protein N-acetyltransferase
MSSSRFPSIIRTPRLVIRCKTPADASLLKAALDSSLDHLRPWMPWAHDEPSTIEVLQTRISKFHADFHSNLDWPYGIFSLDESVLLGGSGLHPRGGPGEIEIGYWLRASAQGQGIATECAQALTQAAFSAPEISKVIIKCDPRNIRSAAIPKRLGYELIGYRPTANPTPERSQDMLWQMKR